MVLDIAPLNGVQ